MKIRHGFVSNSSSSSFIIPLALVTAEQIEQIQNHSALGAEMDIDYAEDAWTIEVTSTVIRGWTSMDNFDMEAFFRRIGVGMKCPGTLGEVQWGAGHF